MKKLLYSFVSLFILFAIGCQENSENPVTSEVFNKPNTVSVINLIRGEIPLEGIIADPSIPGVEYYNLSGIIIYEHRLLSGPEPIETVVLSLTIKATLQNLAGTSTMLIAGETSDTLYINEFGYMLEKSFPIPELKRNLVCSFFVTSESVVLSGRWLEVPGND